MSVRQMPPWDGEPREMGEVWRLTKRSHLAVCRHRTHPYGGEVCLDVDNEMLRIEAGRAWQPLIDRGAGVENAISREGLDLINVRSDDTHYASQGRNGEAPNCFDNSADGAAGSGLRVW